jgi:hypothetical protein
VKKTVFPIVIVAGLLALPFPFFAPWAKGAADQGASSSQHPETPIMVWRGASEVGYLRVELWVRPTASDVHNQELVVKSVSREYTETYSGVMIPLPYDIKTEPDVRQMFIRVSDTGVPGFSRELSIVATISVDGTLHLYACGVRSLVPPCVLHPIE